jgi:hypothetical protein
LDTWNIEYSFSQVKDSFKTIKLFGEQVPGSRLSERVDGALFAIKQVVAGWPFHRPEMITAVDV